MQRIYFGDRDNEGRAILRKNRKQIAVIIFFFAKNARMGPARHILKSHGLWDGLCHPLNHSFRRF